MDTLAASLELLQCSVTLLSLLQGLLLRCIHPCPLLGCSTISDSPLLPHCGDSVK